MGTISDAHTTRWYPFFNLDGGSDRPFCNADRLRSGCDRGCANIDAIAITHCDE